MRQVQVALFGANKNTFCCHFSFKQYNKVSSFWKNNCTWLLCQSVYNRHKAKAYIFMTHFPFFSPSLSLFLSLSLSFSLSLFLSLCIHTYIHLQRCIRKELCQSRVTSWFAFIFKHCMVVKEKKAAFQKLD